ncbi:hypothetical protein [Salmonella enterica]|uniref:hypothetical protein n=1 Tax=Salmonella enterica TaxID=28901 RepID=UPI0021B4AE6C|nr:hypothetical protein [Salmonella enterica]MCT7180587.1 hypothetical protein [Salmonella enterica subsp. enterica serovar Pomona]
MKGKKQPTRQTRSANMRKDAGLTQVKVYLDETTLELLALLQENLSEGKMKCDEINMFRSIAVTAAIHSQAEARLGRKVVSDIVTNHLGAECRASEATENPHKFLLRTMIKPLYEKGLRNSHRRRLAEVAEILNESSYRAPKGKKGGWKENDIVQYVSSDIMLEK